MQSDERNIIMDLDYEFLRHQMETELKNDIFAKDAFMQYVESRLVTDSLSRDIISNITEYAMNDSNFYDYEKDALPNFLSDIIPDIEFTEAAIFCSDSLLSESAKEEKQQFIESIEQEHPEFRKEEKPDISHADC